MKLSNCQVRASTRVTRNTPKTSSTSLIDTSSITLNMNNTIGKATRIEKKHHVDPSVVFLLPNGHQVLPLIHPVKAAVESPIPTKKSPERDKYAKLLASVLSALSGER